MSIAMSLAALVVAASVLKGVLIVTADLMTNQIVAIGVAAGSRVRADSR